MTHMKSNYTTITKFVCPKISNTHNLCFLQVSTRFNIQDFFRIQKFGEFLNVFHKILSRWRMKFNAIFVRISNGVLGMKQNGAQKIDAKDVDAKDILKSDV